MRLKDKETQMLKFRFAGNWYGGKRPYHHTGFITICYAMRESLQMLAEEGLETAWARHLRLHKDLWKGLRELGLEPFVEDEKDRLITVNTIKVTSFFGSMLGFSFLMATHLRSQKTMW